MELNIQRCLEHEVMDIIFHKEIHTYIRVLI